MRIIAGRWKGRRLLGGEHLRPTSDRVKEALFSILGGQLSGVFVDLFAGTGSVGLEAASRGARAVLVERDERSLDLLRENVRALEAGEATTVIERDAQRWVRERTGLALEELPVAVVFADPPYDYGPVEKLLRVVALSPLAGPDTAVVLQHRRGSAAPGRKSADLILERQEAYGDTVLSFLRRTG